MTRKEFLNKLDSLCVEFEDASNDSNGFQQEYVGLDISFRDKDSEITSHYIWGGGICPENDNAKKEYYETV